MIELTVVGLAPVKATLHPTESTITAPKWIATQEMRKMTDTRIKRVYKEMNSKK